MALHIEDVELVHEASLVERSRLGDADAFGELYRLHHDRLFRYCSYQLRNRHDAEDAVQEAFARAWRSLPTFAGENFYPWLRVIARNLCADTGRRRARVEPKAEIELGTTDAADAGMAHEVDLQFLRLAMERLPERHRVALEWREHEELSYEEIAARAGVSLGTVESLLWRARQGLKRQFEMVAGPEGALSGVPGLAWVVSRLRRFHTWAVQGINRWSGPMVSIGNLAAISAVGVAAAVGSLGGGGLNAPGIDAIRVSSTGMGPSQLVSVNAASAGMGLIAPTFAAPSAAPSAAAGPSTPGTRWVRNPVLLETSRPVAAKREISGDPVGVNVPGASVGVDPSWTVQYALDVAANHVPK